MAKPMIIDGHFHSYAGCECSAFLAELMDRAGLSAIGIASCPKGLGYDELFCNAEIKEMQSKLPGRLYLFGGLDYSDSSCLEGKGLLAEQAKKIIAAGVDGIKMIEGKPDARLRLGIPLDAPQLEPFYALLESAAVPLLLHVADPEKFWDPVAAPEWAKKEGWFWGDGKHPSKEQLYQETTSAIRKFPALKVILAHFFFLSGDLERAARFLDQHKNVCFDLTPGVEMYHDFSLKPAPWREFFTRYQDRLIFGTDSLPPKNGDIQKSLENCLKHMAGIREFLETDNPCFSGRGLGLDAAVLEKIYAHNFLRLLRRG